MVRYAFDHRHLLTSASTAEWRLCHANDHRFCSVILVLVVKRRRMSSERRQQQKLSTVLKDPLAVKGELHELLRDALLGPEFSLTLNCPPLH